MIKWNWKQIVSCDESEIRSYGAILILHELKVAAFNPKISPNRMYSLEPQNKINHYRYLTKDSYCGMI